jgi:hypothetical protein
LAGIAERREVGAAIVREGKEGTVDGIVGGKRGVGRKKLEGSVGVEGGRKDGVGW